jgi:hypothetical protein
MAKRDAFSELRAQGESSVESNDQKVAPNLARQPLDLIPAASLKKKRSRQWEKDHRSETVTYRGIPRTVLADLLDLSENLDVPRDEVLRALLEHSLHRYRDGELNLITYPKALRMTLFPKEVTVSANLSRDKSTRQKWLSDAFPVPEKLPKRYGKKKDSKEKEISSWQVRVTFRMPTLLKEEVRNVARNHFVAVGEVVWLFVIEGLKDYYTGAFLLNPVPKSIGKTLFQER